MTKERLLRRARLVARLHHPNLARMLPLPGGAGLTPVTNGARALADFSTSDGAFSGLDLVQVIWLLLDVLNGLRALHELEVDGSGFVHGAISPQYILLGEPGDACLVPITSAHLNASAARETSGYAAPEALLESATDQRADLFSVGVLLWEALAQRRLFPNGSRDAVMAQRARGQAPALGDLVSVSWALPLCHVAERATAVAPAERFGSALELSSAIVAAVGPRLTSPLRDARSHRAEMPVPVPEPALSAPRWRSATPLSLVIDLPPLLRDAVERDDREVAVASTPAPDFTAQPALRAQRRRWQPILTGLAALLLACGVWQLVPRNEPHAARQPTTAPPLLAVVTSTPLAVVTSTPLAVVTSTPLAVVTSTPVVATVVAGAPLPSTSTTAATRPSASAAAARPARTATPRKPRPKLLFADGDYGI